MVAIPDKKANETRLVLDVAESGYVRIGDVVVYVRETSRRSVKLVIQGPADVEIIRDNVRSVEPKKRKGA